MSLRERLFAWSLSVYPTPFRKRFGDSMLETFRDGCLERRADGARAALWFAARSLANVVYAGIIERFHPSFAPNPSPRAPRESARSRTATLGWIVKEFRLAARSLARSPGFALLATVTLALGVGANTAIFSVVNGVLLRPLDYPQPERIVSVMTEWQGSRITIGSASYPDLVDLESASPAIESLAGVNVSAVTLTGLGDPTVLRVTRVTKGILEIFRVAPVMGRDIRVDEFGPNGPRVIVIGYGFWQARFGGRADVLGNVVYLNELPFEIVGVAPEGFDYPGGAELWIPRRLDPEDCARGCHTMRGIGRLAADADVETADVEVRGIATHLEEAYPDTNTRKSFLVRSLQEQMVGDVRQGLLVLLGAVGLVVLIACANVANLLLVRASSRTGEIAIRTAMGASRVRLAAQALIESFVLAVGGGASGVLLAWSAIRYAPHFASSIPRLESVSIDANVLVYTLVTIVVVTLLFGMVPAFAHVRSSIRSGLGSTRTGASAEKTRFRSTLLAAEVALSAILLVGAGLMLRSFVALYAVDMGFETRHVTRFSLNLPETRYDSLAKLRTFYRGLEQEIAELPGVAAVGSVWGPPLGRGHASGMVYVSGRPEPTPEEEREASIHSVSPKWIDTMRIRLLRGRTLNEQDDVGPQKAALVNERFVTENFPTEDPMGKRFVVAVSLGYGTPEWTIVGIVSNVRSRAIDREPESAVYLPHGMYGPENMTVTVRSQAGAPDLLPAVRAMLSEKDADVPMYRVETLDEAVARHVAPTRFYFWLVAAFAFLAAVLASVGLYGVVAFNASRRTREIGIRVALGAERGSILAMIVREGLGPALVGLSIGLSVAFLGSRVMESILFEVSTRDPWIFVATAVLQIVVALIAAAVPANRASRVAPAEALHVE